MERPWKGEFTVRAPRLYQALVGPAREDSYFCEPFGASERTQYLTYSSLVEQLRWRLFALASAAPDMQNCMLTISHVLLFWMQAA